MEGVPAISVLAVLEGFRAIGLDADRLAREANVDIAELKSEDAVLGYGAFEKLWEAAWMSAPREELAIEVGLALPVGVFGVIDYLAASADTVGGAFQSVNDYFANIELNGSLELTTSTEEIRVEFVHRRSGPHGFYAVDCAIAILVSRFRTLAEEFPVVSIALTRPTPRDPERFEALLGAPLSFERGAGAIHLRPDALDVATKTPDPMLRRTLESMASRLSLGDAVSPLERAIRSRLRSLLPKGEANALRVARSLGMSERTLHRRLSELDRNYQDVLDTFRRAEAERLLAARRAGMTDIALALGFGDQSAFARAFRRWTGLSPTAWVVRNA